MYFGNGCANEAGASDAKNSRVGVLPPRLTSRKPVPAFHLFTEEYENPESPTFRQSVVLSA